MSIIVPTNEDTKTINYNIRMMLTDNLNYPKTYEISKILDTFPFGIMKCTLAQCHYNEHTDLCGKVEEEGNPLNDGKVHMICDYYKSSLKPSNGEDENKFDDDGLVAKWQLSEAFDKLYVNGQPQTIKAIPDISSRNVCEWHIFIDNEERISRLDSSYSGDPTDTFISNYYAFKNDKNGTIEKYYLQDYFNISVDDENNTFTIAAINKDMIGYIIKIAIYDADRSYYDFVEMEVVA